VILKIELSPSDLNEIVRKHIEEKHKVRVLGMDWKLATVAVGHGPHEKDTMEFGGVEVQADGDWITR